MKLDKTEMLNLSREIIKKQALIRELATNIVDVQDTEHLIKQLQLLEIYLKVYNNNVAVLQPRYKALAQGLSL